MAQKTDDFKDNSIRDICKLRKRQGQYPEFGHTQGEIQKLLSTPLKALILYEIVIWMVLVSHII
jgi:hypothetical protein